MESCSNQKMFEQIKAPPHHPTSSSMLHGGSHTCRAHLFAYSASHKDTAVGTKNLKFGSDQRTDFHWSNVHCSCFLAQASLFFLLVSFGSDFFEAFDHEGLIHSLLWTVDVEMCLLFVFCEAFSEAGSSNELILCSKCNSGSYFPVEVLMRASFIILLDDFCNPTWRNFQSSWNVPDWLTFMS